MLQLCFGLLLIGSSLGRRDQCNLVIDSFTDEEYDYIYRHGTIISLEPIGRKVLECIPENKGARYDNIQCFWWQNGNDYLPVTYSFPTNNGCTIHLLNSNIGNSFTAGGSVRNNFTCETYNNLTKGRTVMSYIIYSLAKESTVVGYLPIVYDRPASKVAYPGKSVNVTCETSLTQASSVFYINWYLISEGKRVDVTTRPNHKVSMCGRSSTDKGKIILMLTIFDITPNLFNQSYECVVTKIDVWSPYNRTLENPKYALHSADPQAKEYVGVVYKPNMSDISQLTYYENNTEGICTKDKPCVAYRNFLLRAPVVKVENLSTFVVVGVSGAIALILAISIPSSYRKRVIIREHLKHYWGLTTDTASPDFKYQAVIFYAENCEEETEQFVQSKLLVKMENKWKYRTLVPQRDYHIGSTKAEECVQGLKKSQKVIFILTEKLFAEEWKIYALDVALNKHRKIILLKMEDINFQELLERFGKKFAEVESALKVATVIDWMKNKDKWRRLHLELPSVTDGSYRHQITSYLLKCQNINK